MLRFIGVICIFIFAFYASFSYERYQKSRLSTGEEMLLLLKFFLDELHGLARSPADCIRGFKASALAKTWESYRAKAMVQSSSGISE